MNKVVREVTKLSEQPKWRAALVAVAAGLTIMPIAGAAQPANPPAAHGHMLSQQSEPGKKRKKEDDDEATAGFQQASLSKAMQVAAAVAPADPTLSSGVDAKKWQPALDKAMRQAHLTTPDQEAAFLAQIDEESDGLALINELPWGLDRSEWQDTAAVREYFNEKYANMNGNGDVASGDGYNYRGRGILQITGKDNYAAVSKQLYGDDRLVKHPDLVSQPDVACAAAAAYWNQNDLNRFIPAGQPVTPDEFQDLGSAINTGAPGNVPHNAAEREHYWEIVKGALGVS